MAARPVAAGAVPAPVAVGTLTFVCLGVRPLVAAFSPAGPGFNGSLPTLVLAVAVAVWILVVGRWWDRHGWDGAHDLAVGAGYSLAVAGAAFIVQPLGDIEPVAKYATNTALLILVLVLIVVGARRARSMSMTAGGG